VIPIEGPVGFKDAQEIISDNGLVHEVIKVGVGLGLADLLMRGKGRGALASTGILVPTDAKVGKLEDKLHDEGGE